MRAVTTGVSKLTLEDFTQLKDHFPFEISQNLRRRILLGDPLSDVKPLLRALHTFSREGNEPRIKMILEALMATPQSSVKLPAASCDLEIASDSKLENTFAGENFEFVMSKFLTPVIRGNSREDVFSSRIGRLIPACAGITIVDRYLGAQVCRDDFTKTGAYWLLNKLIDAQLSNIEILTSKRDGSENLNFSVFGNRLQGIIQNSKVKVRIYGKMGFAPHDRHITFHYSQGRGTESVTLGAGTDVFRNEILSEGFSIVPLEQGTAFENEKIVLDSHGKDFEF